MKSVSIEKAAAHAKKYGIVYATGILFFYCFMQMPLHYDQLVSTGIYGEYCGFINYLTGYCWWWANYVNGRFLSTFVSGILESNYTVFFFLESLMLALFPVACARIFSLRKEDEGKLIWVSALIVFLLSRAIELEVISYALFLYFAPILMILYLVRDLDGLMPEAETAVSPKYGYRYLGIVLVLGLWLENITFAMLAISICLYIWDLKVNHRNNRYLLVGIDLSAFCFWVMLRLRQGAVFQDTDLSARIAFIEGKTTAVLFTTFWNNPALTAFIAVIAFLRLLSVMKRSSLFAFPEGKQRKSLFRCGKIFGSCALLIFWGCIAVYHLVLAYNNEVVYFQSLPVPLMGGQMTALPTVALSVPILPELPNVALYFLFSLSLIVPVLICKRRLALLTVYGFSLASLGCLFFTGEYFGSRVITPSLLLLAVTMTGVCADTLVEFKSTGKLTRFSAVLVVLLILLRCDYYLCRYTEIGEITRYNEKIIEAAVERQAFNEWDYASDVLVLQAYSANTQLFCSSIAYGDPHFPFFCQYYHLSEETQVAYK